MSKYTDIQKLRTESLGETFLKVFIPIYIGIPCAIAFLAFLDGLPGTIKNVNLPTTGPMSDVVLYIFLAVYVLIRLAIITVKIMVPYLIVRYIIEEFELSRWFYAIVVAAGILAIATDGSGYRKHLKENPEIVTAWNEAMEDDPSLGKKILCYEVYRVFYDLQWFEEKMDKYFDWKHEKFMKKYYPEKSKDLQNKK